VPGGAIQGFGKYLQPVRSNAGPVFFTLCAAYFLSVFTFYARPFSFSLDPSITWAANVAGDYGLEIGRDIVHVFGPLGWLYYPGPVHHHLHIALALQALLVLSLAGGLALFAFTTRNFAAPSVLLLFLAFFPFGYLSEPLLYAAVLVLLILDYRLPRYRFWILPAALSAVFFFVKFNFTVSLPLLLAAYVAARWRYRTISYAKTAGILGTFAAIAAIIGLGCFSAPAHFTNWFVQSLHISLGRSEAMSLPPGAGTVLSAVATLGALLWLALSIRRGAGAAASLLWGALALILFAFGFKHGLVRADASHIQHFFRLLPVVAASSLLLRGSRGMVVGVALVALLGVVTPIFHGAALRPPVPFSGIARSKLMWHTSRSSWDTAIPVGNAQSALTEEELQAIAIGYPTAHVVPFDAALLHRTGLTWRPSPFFQLFTARTFRTDAINAAHFQSAEAAMALVYNWHILDDIYPLWMAPASQLAIMQHYDPVAVTEGRLLMRKRRSARSFVPRTVSRSRVRLDEPVAVPASRGILLAKLSMRYTPAGRALKSVAWAPAVHLEINGGGRWRFVPSTAAAGIIVNPLPQDIHQLRSLLETGAAGPECPDTLQVRIVPDSGFPYFADGIDLEFVELAPAPGNRGE